MTNGRVNSGGRRILALLMSLVLVIMAMLPSKAYAAPGPYTPPTPVTPGYTGALTWMNFTPPNSVISGRNTIFLTIDGEDNIYVTVVTAVRGSISTFIEKISADGQEITDLTYDSELKEAMGIAVDNNGNVYVVENTSAGKTNARILMLEKDSETWEDITHGEIIKAATGIAADHKGNVYVAEANPGSEKQPTGNERILKLSSGSNSWVNILNDSAPLVNPIDLAVDGEGNLFVSDIIPPLGKIYKLPAGSSTWTDITPNTGESLFAAYGIGVDPYDNLYAMNLYNVTPMKLGYNGGSQDWMEIPVMSNPAYSIVNYDVDVNSNGYIFTTNASTSNILTLKR